MNPAREACRGFLGVFNQGCKGVTKEMKGNAIFTCNIKGCVLLEIHKEYKGKVAEIRTCYILLFLDP